jgi:hypothetical protein
VYFNLEAATVLLSGWSFVWVNALGFSMQRILLLFRAGRLSYRALVPALLSFYPLFYVSRARSVQLAAAHALRLDKHSVRFYCMWHVAAMLR